MKRLFVILCVLFSLLLPVMCVAADMHKVQLESVAPFAIETSFPNMLENDSFWFRVIGEGEYNDLAYRAVVGISRADKRYQILLILVTLETEKAFHVVAAVSANMVSKDDRNMISYRDEVFYSGSGFSGLLTRCKEAPLPKDIEKVSRPKRLNI
jgi:hypothetical protein